MRNFRGNLAKMECEMDDPVRYRLRLGTDYVSMNELLGRNISISFEGVINCRICGKKTNKAFGEGFCYYHFMKAPENAPCIVRPELCEAHLGKGRDPEWEIAHHKQPHIVYLALTSGLKVGVTRQDQIPGRWIDQGAWKAIRLAETPYRQIAGQIEVALKSHVSDKTHWQNMLKGIKATDIDPLARKKVLATYLEESLQAYLSDNDEITELHYPVIENPEKVKSLKLDKTPHITSALMGIRGQYLIFQDGLVLNVRSHTGYFVEFSFD